MAKKQGKVKAIPVKEVTEGMQVLAPDGKIYHIQGKEIPDYVKMGMSLRFAKERISELKTLIVEYEGYDKDKFNAVGKGCIGDIQIPLKYSQWQAALDKGEVDSDKEVGFEIIEAGIADSKYAKEYGSKVDKYAKIIPQKETWDDIENRLKNAWTVEEIFYYLKKSYHPPKRK